ncbi:unnamed protein product [Brassica oleracea]
MEPRSSQFKFLKQRRRLDQVLQGCWITRQSKIESSCSSRFIILALCNIQTIAWRLTNRM